MRLLHSMSIKRKQMLIIMLTSTVALSLACTIFVVSDIINFRKAIVKNVSALAEAVGNNCSGAIEYDDANTAAETLRALRAEPSIVAACVYTRKGDVFASYNRSGAPAAALPPAPASGYEFKGGLLNLFHPITQREETIGTIFVMSDLSDLKERLGRYPAILGGMFASAMLVSFMLSSRLQRVISDPILHLARVARTVALEKNYSVRAKKKSGDELGQLIDGFNEMLAQIQARDAALGAAHNTLERRVEERTEELRQSQSLYHSLVEHLPMLVYRKDRHGRFLFANSQFCQFHGKPADQILGKTTREVTGNQELAEQITREEQTIIDTGAPVEVEREYLDPAGNVKFLQIFESPILDSAGKVTGIQGMLLDVTERKQTAAKLEQANRELVATSRQAGMAEVATSVLHNVGNVLNSVNISAEIISATLKASKIVNVARVVTLIQEHSENLGEFITRDPRGRQIPQFLAALSEHLSLEQTQVLKEADSLRQHVEHIKNIVAMQQSYARVAGVTEIVNVRELVEYALGLNVESMERQKVQLIRNYDPQVPDITVDKHKVLQILVNLIRNARRACEESGKAEKILSIALRTAGEHLEVAVSDNGIGIPPENLTRIFNHGFTTMRGGHGFGLHNGALAAKEMNGTLTVHSDGSGLGATFILRLPRQQKARQSERLTSKG